jgi:hypothetical protein
MVLAYGCCTVFSARCGVHPPDLPLLPGALACHVRVVLHAVRL